MNGLDRWYIIEITGLITPELTMAMESSNIGRALSGDKFYWHNFADEMLKLSASFPEYIFQVSHTFDDMWATYFKEGKKYSVCASLSFPPFDASQLK